MIYMYAEHCQNNCTIFTPDTSLSIAFKNVAYMYAEHYKNNCIEVSHFKKKRCGKHVF